VNLLFVLDRFPTVSETFVLNELRELERQGDAVHVVSRRPPIADEPVHAGAKELAARTLYLPGRLRLGAAALATVATRPGRALPALAWCVRARPLERGTLRAFAEAAYVGRRLPAGVEHVHAHFAHGATTVALALARLTGLPFSFTAHARDLFAVGRPALLRRKIAAARLVVAVSEHTRRLLVELARPADRERIALVRSGIEAVAAGPRPSSPPAPPLVLTVARLVEKKGADTAIEASARLRARGVDHAWTIAGEGPLRAELEPRAAAAGVVLAGAVDQGGVHEALGRAAVFVLPCRVARDGDRDVLPVSLVEAMAAGVPVVTTPIGGIGELVRDGETGLLVEPDNAEAVADAVARLLRDPALCARLVAGGRRAAAGHELTACVGDLRALLAAA
jgi:glycosyltransferase involved in cell wall biosynthesis